MKRCQLLRGVIFCELSVRIMLTFTHKKGLSIKVSLVELSLQGNASLHM